MGGLSNVLFATTRSGDLRTLLVQEDVRLSGVANAGESVYVIGQRRRVFFDGLSFVAKANLRRVKFFGFAISIRPSKQPLVHMA